MPELAVAPSVASSIEELLAGAERREPMTKTADSLSGSSFESVWIDGERHVLKHLHVDDDWIARATGDYRCRARIVWETGLIAGLPDCIDTAIVGVAGDLGRDGLGAAVLMRDVGPSLVPEGASPLPLAQHRRFLEHMARMHATFWDFEDTIGLHPLGNRIYEVAPSTGDVEAARGGTDVVPPMIRPGWERTRRDAPLAGAIAWACFDDPSDLMAGLIAGPRTFVHGDWKAGNLGSTPDGRTILLDWAVPGEAPPLADLIWYIAVNCDRLPESKDATFSAYRAALEDSGVPTDPWWDEQVDLAVILGFVQMGWCKGGEELAWWEQRVPAAAGRRL